MPSPSKISIAVCLTILICSASWAADYGDVVVSRVVSVYDGDTFRVDIDDWPRLVGENISVRIADIDCPEMKGAGEDHAAAIEARDILRNLLTNAKTVVLRNLRRGDFFRIVADVYVDGVDVKTVLPCNAFTQ